MKNNMKFISIVDSQNDNSYNNKLIHFMSRYFSSNHKIEILDTLDIPFYKDESQDLINQEPFKSLVNKIRWCDGVIIPVPQINNSIPASLKSIIDWLSYYPHPLSYKSIMLVSVSNDSSLPTKALSHLSQILESPQVNAKVSPANNFIITNAPEKFEENNLIDEEALTELENRFQNFINHSTSVQLLKELDALSTVIEYEAGTYSVLGKGKNGDIPIKVTFSENNIESIEVDKSGETEGISDASFTLIPQQIIDGQTLNVDIVSGASVTSIAIRDGVADAVKQAGGNPDVLRARPKSTSTNSTEIIKEDYDLVVVGGGAAGMATAIRAEQLGLSVVLIDKQTFIGGAIQISGGNQVVAGSNLQKENGVTNDSLEKIVEDFEANGNHKNYRELLTLFAENVGQTTDWLNEEIGIQFEPGLHRLAEYQVNRELAYKGGGSGFAKTIREYINKSSITVYYSTRATELTTDEHGDVTGLIAEAKDGTQYEFTSKAVALTTGGYGNNNDYLTPELQKVLYYGPTSSTGDGLALTDTDNIQAGRINMEFGKVYPNGIEVAPGKAMSTIGGNLIVLKTNALLVNKSGQRVIDETASNHDILNKLYEQEDQMLYILMDSKNFEKFSEGVAEGGINKEDIARWLNNNGSETPYFMHADSLDELAEIAGMETNALTKTVQRYNEIVEAGVDTDFNRPNDYIQEKIGDGPYYLVEQKPRFATTMGGLKVNDQLQVEDKNDNVIQGLYAAGEVVGGVMGTDSPSGANNAWALTSGKLAAESIVEKIG